MRKRLGVIMDPIGSIHYKKDSTLAMLWEAKNRGWELFYFELGDLFLKDGVPFGDAKALQVFQDDKQWFKLDSSQRMALKNLNVILMRKDPPFNQEYIYATYILEHAEKLGVTVVNKSQSLRDFNEKLFATYFPECSPPSLVTRSSKKLYEFWDENEDIVCKPLDSMGGTSVFRLRREDVNAKVIFETLTKNETSYIMAQRFIPEITKGDKRIILINGEAIPYALARVPQGKDWRGNLAVGAKAVVQPLSERDMYICEALAPMLRKHGLYFVGIDVIGDYLTEINITSPTGIREIDNQAGTNISAKLFDAIEQKI